MEAEVVGLAVYFYIYVYLSLVATAAVKYHTDT